MSADQQKILLEAGTNEVEILEFLLCDQSFGINVAKVISIVQYDPELLTRIPEAPPEIMGTFIFRDQPLPLIDTTAALHRGRDEVERKQLVIAVEFNSFQCGLYVDGVERIHAVSWNQFIPLEDAFSAGMRSASILGTVHIDQKDVLIIDIESLATQLFAGLSMDEFTSADDGTDMAVPVHSRGDVHVVFAEDSSFIRKNIVRILHGAGYSQVSQFENGKLANEYVGQLISEGKQPDAVISDIEMPMMDGLSFVKSVREKHNLKKIPVIMFSSLINEQMEIKCTSVGANRCITKPKIGNLVEMLDELCSINPPRAVTDRATAAAAKFAVADESAGAGTPGYQGK